ncbi:AraC family transcriptional regulator [Amycolatopsis sp. H20-H5]|uniref:AraC family transcriptional regulator n=1 Tax=Amycolatopsis sp. H20-H5 TaxID=3046309 RepID=UPI002DBD1D42|nr:helix-turn-helix transcriptional regulator [Amycolatopsis sp. H20-H5]MEC3981369.1 helix-turn-helix transcriptional regulator [Amycolatopsis sp. H20-H5]
MSAGTWYASHDHDRHQLVWAARGIVAVGIGDEYWVLPPTRALWVPAGVGHRTGAPSRARMLGIYAEPGSCPVSWPGPRLVAVRPVLRELLEYLAGEGITDDARRRAEAVAFDLLQPIEVVPITVPLPADERARVVARVLLADPADPRGLAEFGRLAGAAERTLARLFLSECQVTFGVWRTQVRLRASLPLLAEGMPLTAVSRRVGYSSPSAFVAAFRRAVGIPPGAYFGS